MVIVMKKLNLLKCIYIISVIAIIMILFVIVKEAYLPNPTIIKMVFSPDGENVAYIFEKNGGATTGFIYHISILPSDKKLGKRNGNIYVNNDLPPNNIEWLSNNELYVDDFKSIGITKQILNINGIEVKYRSLETN